MATTVGVNLLWVCWHNYPCYHPCVDFIGNPNPLSSIIECLCSLQCFLFLKPFIFDKSFIFKERSTLIDFLPLFYLFHWILDMYIYLYCKGIYYHHMSFCPCFMCFIFKAYVKYYRSSIYLFALAVNCFWCLVKRMIKLLSYTTNISFLVKCNRNSVRCGCISVTRCFGFVKLQGVH